MNQEQASNVLAAAGLARKCEAMTGIPAQFVLAQYIVESGWGSHQPGFNCFGIKAYPGCYGKQLLNTVEWFTDKELESFLKTDPSRTAKATDEFNGDRKKYLVQDWFATFQSLFDCFMYRARMFKYGRYSKLSNQYLIDKNLESYVRDVAKIYATAPNYGDVLMSIIRDPKVQDILTRVNLTT